MAMTQSLFYTLVEDILCNRCNVEYKTLSELDLHYSQVHLEEDLDEDFPSYAEKKRLKKARVEKLRQLKAELGMLMMRKAMLDPV